MRANLMAAAIAAVAAQGCATVHTETFIEAPPNEVWAVLSDPAGYEEWNPVFVHAEGTLREDETMTYRVRETEGEEYTMEANVEEVVDGEKLNQRGGTWGILTFDHTWQLVPENGGTRVIQHEEYGGIGVIFWNHDWIEPAYSRANEALKTRVLRALEERRRRRDDLPGPQTSQ